MSIICTCVAQTHSTRILNFIFSITSSLRNRVFHYVSTIFSDVRTDVVQIEKKLFKNSFFPRLDFRNILRYIFYLFT
jgi:hypothetical protein